MDNKTMDTETGEMIVKRVSVPVGLEELMEGLAKEVLLKKPDDLYLFAAKYFSQLLLLRDKSNYKVKTIRSAQSMIEHNQGWSNRKFVPRAPTKQLSCQSTNRDKSPNKNVSSKIPQKEKNNPKREVADKYLDTNSESFTLEGKQTYLTNKHRSISIDRPRNTHYRERSQSSTDRARFTPNVTTQPVPKQRRSLIRTGSKTKSDTGNKDLLRNEDIVKIRDDQQKKLFELKATRKDISSNKVNKCNATVCQKGEKNGNKFDDLANERLSGKDAKSNDNIVKKVLVNETPLLESNRKNELEIKPDELELVIKHEEKINDQNEIVGKMAEEKPTITDVVKNDDTLVEDMIDESKILRSQTDLINTQIGNNNIVLKSPFANTLENITKTEKEYKTSSESKNIDDIVQNKKENNSAIDQETERDDRVHKIEKVENESKITNKNINEETLVKGVVNQEVPTSKNNMMTELCTSNLEDKSENNKDKVNNESIERMDDSKDDDYKVESEISNLTNPIKRSLDQNSMDFENKANNTISNKIESSLTIDHENIIKEFKNENCAKINEKEMVEDMSKSTNHSNTIQMNEEDKSKQQSIQHQIDHILSERESILEENIRPNQIECETNNQNVEAKKRKDLEINETALSPASANIDKNHIARENQKYECIEANKIDVDGGDTEINYLIDNNNIGQNGITSLNHVLSPKVNDLIKTSLDKSIFISEGGNDLTDENTNNDKNKDDTNNLENDDTNESNINEISNMKKISSGETNTEEEMPKKIIKETDKEYESKSSGNENVNMHEVCNNEIATSPNKSNDQNEKNVNYLENGDSKESDINTESNEYEKSENVIKKIDKEYKAKFFDSKDAEMLEVLTNKIVTSAKKSDDKVEENANNLENGLKESDGSSNIQRNYLNSVSDTDITSKIKKTSSNEFNAEQKNEISMNSNKVADEGNKSKSLGKKDVEMHEVFISKMTASGDNWHNKNNQNKIEFNSEASGTKTNSEINKINYITIDDNEIAEKILEDRKGRKNDPKMTETNENISEHSMEVSLEKGSIENDELNRRLAELLIQSKDSSTEEHEKSSPLELLKCTDISEDSEKLSSQKETSGNDEYKKQSEETLQQCKDCSIEKTSINLDNSIIFHSEFLTNNDIMSKNSTPESAKNDENTQQHGLDSDKKDKTFTDKKEKKDNDLTNDILSEKCDEFSENLKNDSMKVALAEHEEIKKQHHELLNQRKSSSADITPMHDASELNEDNLNISDLLRLTNKDIAGDSTILHKKKSAEKEDIKNKQVELSDYFKDLSEVEITKNNSVMEKEKDNLLKSMESPGIVKIEDSNSNGCISVNKQRFNDCIEKRENIPENITATISVLKTGIINKVVKDYITSFIDNERNYNLKIEKSNMRNESIKNSHSKDEGTAELENSLISLDNNLMISDDDIKATISTNDTPKLCTEIDTIENKSNYTDSYHNSNFGKEILKGTDTYLETKNILNKAVAILKIQSLWRGFIVRKNLNIFNNSHKERSFNNEKLIQNKQTDVKQNEEDQIVLNTKANMDNYNPNKDKGETNKYNERDFKGIFDTKNGIKDSKIITPIANNLVMSKDEISTDQNDNQESKDNKNSLNKDEDYINERPTSMDSTDSVITVVYNRDFINHKEDKEDINKSKELLEPISGSTDVKSISVEDKTTNKNNSEHKNNLKDMSPNKMKMEHFPIKEIQNGTQETISENVVEQIKSEQDEKTPFCITPFASVSENKTNYNKGLSENVESINNEKNVHNKAFETTNNSILKNHESDCNLSYTNGILKSELIQPVIAAKEKLLENTELAKNSISFTDSTNENFNSYSQLLHTGELHDTLVLSLPSAIENLTKPQEKDHVNEEKAKTELPHPSYGIPFKTGLLHTGELHDTLVLPLPLDMVSNSDSFTKHNFNQSEKVEEQDTASSSMALFIISGVTDVNAERIAQTPDKGGLDRDVNFSPSASDLRSMESQTSVVNVYQNDKNMEAEAATKIQAGFRGYQVRKQLKLKNGSFDMNNQKRPKNCSRKNSGKNNSSKIKDVEEKSAVKIQAGIRGFLVRRKQNKQNNKETK